MKFVESGSGSDIVSKAAEVYYLGNNSIFSYYTNFF